MRKCSTCHELKALDQFYFSKDEPLGREYRCKKCRAKIAKEYNLRSEVKITKAQQHLKRKYGITIEEKQEMYLVQDGLCKICCIKLNMQNCHIDHNHETGKVRALLCGTCNKMLGLARDDIFVLQSAIDYLTLFK